MMRLNWFWGWCFFGVLAIAGPAAAQSNIVVDQTLGTSSAQVQRFPAVQIELIDGGLQSDRNLFHSFENFNVAEGWQTYFLAQDAGIENILARVTGNLRSDILGVLGTGRLDGTSLLQTDTNLFLINPNGVLFGPRARLSVGSATRGSFFATTLDGVVWPDGRQFDGLTSQGTEPLLEIVGDPSGFIASQRAIPPVEVNNSILLADPGQSLVLLGGDVLLNGAILGTRSQTSEGIPVILGGLKQAGTITFSNPGLATQNQGTQWRFPAGVLRGNVSLQQNATISVSSEGQGRVEVYGQDVRIDGNSRILGGIFPLGGFEGAEAGDLLIDAQGRVRVVNGRISNNVSTQGQGQGGDVTIRARSVDFAAGAELAASTFGLADAGNIRIEATEYVRFQDAQTAAFSDVNATANFNAKGQGGQLSIEAPIIEVLGGAQLSTSLEGEGAAGTIQLQASERILFEGTSPDGEFGSGALTLVDVGGLGPGGDVILNAPRIEVKDGAQIIAGSAGMGDAGNVLINASDRISFDAGDAFTNITAEGQGNAGDIILNAPTLEFTEVSQLISATLGIGDAGDIELTASEKILFQGSSADGLFASGAGSSVEAGAVGTGGNIRINTPVLEVLDGAGFRSDTQGQGDAGSINISANERVLFQGTSADGGLRSSARTGVGNAAQGSSGDIVIRSPILELFDGASLNSQTSGRGNGGDIDIEVSDRVVFKAGSGALTSVNPGAQGDGGEITINAPVLNVSSGSQLLTLTQGQGNAGNIGVTADERIEIQGADIVSGRSSAIFTNNGLQGRTGSGNSGTIALTTPELSIRDGAVVDARTTNDKLGGDIRFNLQRFELLNGGQVITSSLGSGPAGDIEILATEQVRIEGMDPTFVQRTILIPELNALYSTQSTLSVQARQSGAAGQIILNTANFSLQDNGQIIAESATGNGGNIFIGTKPEGNNVANIPTIAPRAIFLKGNSLISATAGDNQNLGDGGNIAINTPFLISFPGGNSDIIANAFEGTGGNITIRSDAILNFQLQDEPNVDVLRSNRTNDISASAQNGASGILSLSGLNVDPSQGNTALPSVPTSGNQVDQTCSAVSLGQNEFTLSGRGGVPLTPQEPQSDAETTIDWVPLPNSQSASVAVTSQRLMVSSIEADSTPPREALGWYRDRADKVVLIAADDRPQQRLQPQSSWQSAVQANHRACHPSSSRG